MNKIKIIAIILAVTTVAGAVLFFVTRGNSPEVPDIPQDEVFSLETSPYTAEVSAAGANGEIFMPTGIYGYYYTADLSGKVEFFTLSDTGFAPASEEKKTAKVSLSASTQSIPVTVNYIKTDIGTVGIGVFSSKGDSSVKYYDYAFAKLIDRPSGYGQGYLLLADYTKEDFYKTNKLYDEIFEYDLKASSVSVRLSQNTRLIDSDANYRKDWDMMTDEFAANLGDAKYFMSSRYYTEAETGIRTDIMVYSGNYRPTVAVKDIVGLWFVNDPNGMHYLKKTDSGFKSVCKKDKDTKDVVTFEGDFFEDYLRSGNNVANKKTGEITNLMTGEKMTVRGVNITGADIFSLSPDGKKAVFAFYGEKNSNGVPVQEVIYCTTDGSADPAVFVEPLLFSESSSFVWINSFAVMSARATDSSGSEVSSVLYTFR